MKSRLETLAKKTDDARDFQMPEQGQTPPKSPLVWSTVESNVARYFVYGPDGTREPDEELRGMVRRASVAFIRFFSDNGLLKVVAFDEENNFIDREYRDGDVHEDALRMIRNGAERWLDSKSALKEPPNYKKLEKMLLDIRMARR